MAERSSREGQGCSVGNDNGESGTLCAQFWAPGSTWHQTITSYLPFFGTDKLHKNQEDFEKPGSEIFWIDLTQRFNHPGPLDIEIKRCHVRSAGSL